MPKTCINPPTLFNTKQYGFSQLVVSRSPGSLFCTSGQVTLDNHENVVGSDLTDQTKQVLTNIALAVQASGGDLADVMSLRIYFVQSEYLNINSIGNVLREFFGTENPPASTWIGVASLTRKDFLIEIEAMGMI